MLTKDLLRVSQVDGGYHPQFADRGDRPLAAKAIGVFRRHVGDTQAVLDDALADPEAEANGFRLARGFALLLGREAVFETTTPLSPVCVRHAAFEAAMSIGGVAVEGGRAVTLDHAASSLGSSPVGVDESLTAGREVG